MVFKLLRPQMIKQMFENDVKMYGIQANGDADVVGLAFENDVKMYGIQAGTATCTGNNVFENDVKMYGIQATFQYRS